MYLTANLLIVPLKGRGYSNTELMKSEFKNGSWGPLKNVGPLKMVNYKDMPNYGFPQVATCLDSKGNLYVYHESGFLDRSGADTKIFYTTNNQGSTADFYYKIERNY